MRPKYSGIVQELLIAGVDINKTTKGFTALHIAVNNKIWDSARYLVDSGADLNAVTPIELNSSLHYAVLQDGYNFMLYLMNKGADPNTRNAGGFTPFDFLVMKNEYPDSFLDTLLPRFLAKKVDLFVPNGLNMTPHEFIKMRLEPDQFEEYLIRIEDYGYTIPPEDIDFLNKKYFWEKRPKPEIPTGHPPVSVIGRIGSKVQYNGRSVELLGGMINQKAGELIKFVVRISGFDPESVTINSYTYRDWNNPLLVDEKNNTFTLSILSFS